MPGSCFIFIKLQTNVKDDISIISSVNTFLILASKVFVNLMNIFLINKNEL